MKSTRGIHRLALLIVLLVAAILRFHQLGEIVGFEHDEALICVGAADIAAGHGLSLTGDKVYEGPLLELLIAAAFTLVKPTVATARAIMALAGLAAVLFTYMLARRLFGPLPAIGAALTAAVSPWALMTSRVIYICNLVPLLAAAGLFAAAKVSSRRLWSLPAAALCIGLATHGHAFALILLIPAVHICHRELSWRSRPVRLALLGSVLILASTVAPVLLFNAAHGWPALRVFAGSEQHAPGAGTNLTDIAGRIGGYLFTAIHSHTGCYLWPDIRLPEGFMLFLPTTLLVALFFVIRGFFMGKPRDRFLVIWLLAACIVVPIISKHRVEWQVWGFAFPSPPHYLDALFPLPCLLFARLLSSLERRRPIARVIPVLLLLIAMENLSFIQGHLRPAFADVSLSGRWARGIQEAAGRIRDTLPAHSPVFVSYVFEAGYPQCRFLLPKHEVIPRLESPTGWYDSNGELRQGTAVYLGRINALFPYMENQAPWFQIPPDPPLWLVYRYETPELQLHGRLTCNGKAGAPSDTFEIRSAVHGLGEGHVELRNKTTGELLVLNELWRVDQVGPYPGFAARAYNITPRHFETLQRLDLTHFGTVLTGAGGRLRLIRGEPAEIMVETAGGITLNCRLEEGAMLFR
ncbi:glycosyltransferase family 39 protein [bacterium]|nr:glycosyltransferase family 39 protein [candidate division CSSED10-310 bacterium]